jgi:N-acylneuraminate cytidylyltransferase
VIENSLFLIPARGGSKGIPKKNIKNFHGLPLIQHTLKAALACTSSQNICVSTDSTEIAEKAIEMGIEIPFIRPAELANDTAGSYEVILHALNHYRELGRTFESVILLQPTSPLRTANHIKEAFLEFDENCDAVLSCQVSHANPYSTIYEDQSGFIVPSKSGNFTRRQDQPQVYELNGAIYVLNTKALDSYHSIREFPRIKKYVMDRMSSIDIDDEIDWKTAELYYTLKNNENE